MLGPSGKAGGCQRVEKGAHLKDDQQHQRENQQTAKQPPARVQEQFVEPEPPAFPRVQAARDGNFFKEHGCTMVAVGVHFFRQRARQSRFSQGSGPGDLRCQIGKTGIQGMQEVIVVFSQLRKQQGAGHLKNAFDIGVADDRFERLQAFGDMARWRLRQRAGFFPRNLDGLGKKC